MSKTALVVVCYNHLETTKKFLNSLIQELDNNTSSTVSDYELYILDNGSTDKTFEYLNSFKEQNHKFGIKVYKSETNLGFAGGNNLLLKEVLKQADNYTNVILINNDTLINKKALDKLVEVCNANEETAATGPVSNRVGGVQLFNRGKHLAEEQYMATAEMLLQRNIQPVEVGMLVGFCLCLKTKIVQEVGLLDERFGLGMWEDNDYSLRLRNAGYRLYVVPNSLIYHYGSQTIQELNPNNLFYENKQKFLDKYKTSKYQKIVALCRVKNGGEVFRKCLIPVSSMCDEVIVFDDNSTDNTAEIAKSFGNIIYHKSQWQDLDEARDRQWLLDKARELKADWCWVMDHDEMPDEKLRQDIRLIIDNANPEKDLFCIKRDDFWDDEEHFRTDGVWGTFWQGRLFRLRKQNVVWTPNTPKGANFHCGPHGPIPSQCIEYIPYKVWHYGNMTAQERLRKYLWYTANDKEKNLTKVLGGYIQHYKELYAIDAYQKGEISDIKDYTFKDKDIYRHVVSNLGKTLAKVQDNKISLSMIVKNEEEYIGQCLESVKDIVDEIVIVDTGSTDRTKEICAKYTDKIYDYKWNDNFADARNYALSKCTGNWILRLDGDEVLPKEQLAELFTTVDNAKADVFIFPITNILSFKPYKTVLSKTARLFRNVPGLKFTGIVHEEIDESVKDLKLKVGRFTGHIVHYGYIKNANALEQKFEFYETLAHKEIEKDPNNFKPYYNLASHYAYLKNYDKAIECYEKALKLNDKSYMIWHDYGVAKHFKMLQENRVKIQEVLDIFEKAKSLLPKDEFSEYRNKLNFNLQRVKGLIV